ncbi:MAG: nuclear transport factor 2 family protein [Thermoleophilia bacterium]
MSGLEDFFKYIKEEDSRGLEGLFAGEPAVDDPQFGRFDGSLQLEDFAARAAAWAGDATVEPVAATDDAEMSVIELVLGINVEEKKIPLPVALAAERKDGGFSAVRVYYSMWPQLGHHLLRPPILPEKEGLPVPDAIGRYHQALTEGDLEGIMAVFEDDGYAREPAGGPWVYQGKEKLREFYGMLFANEGGIKLEHCTFTDDGVRGALEYNAMAWGKTRMPPQAGIAVYERGRSGLLHAARIYDDVDPPL